MVSRRTGDVIALGAMAAALLSIAASLAGRFVLDIDDVNLALAIEHFDVRMHQPHPPGYLGYVLLLRAVHFLTRAPLLDVPRWTARLFALLTIVLAWRAGQKLADRGRWAALLVATNPILLYYAVDGQTHAAEAAMAAALVWALAAPERRAVVCGLLVAAGGSFRPTYLMLAGVAVAWAFWRDWRRLGVVLLLALLGTLAWFIPTVIMTGGLAAYRAANQALVGELMARFSLLSGSGDPRYIALNLRDTLLWGVLALLPMAIAVRGRALWIGLTIAVPSLLFYLFVICAEAGYLAGLVAPAAVAGAVGAVGRRRWAAAAIALAQLGFFLVGPQQILRSYMLPDVNEIVERDVRAQFLFEALHHDLPSDTRVLLLSDFPDLTILRQMPLVRPASEVLFAHDAAYFAAAGQSWISFATAHGWHAAPGVVLRNDDDDHTLSATGEYQFVALDPRASNDFRALLRPQMSCPVLPETDDETRAAQRWPISCFHGALRFYARTLRF